MTPLRVLQVNKFHYHHGGSERIYLGLSELLEQRGVTVGHFSMSGAKNLPSPESGYFTKEIRYDDGGPVRKAINAMNIVYSVDARRQMERLLRDEPYDVVHLHNFQHQLSPSILPAIKARGIPIVYTTHDLKMACGNYRMYTHDGVCERCKGGRHYNGFVHRCTKGSRLGSFVNMVEMYTHQWAGYYDLIDRFVTPSTFMRDKFVEFGFPEEKFVHIPNYVDLAGFPEGEGDGAYALYLGRLEPEKGLTTLLDAARESPDVPLRIAGDGVMLGEIRQAVEHPALRHVTVLGRVPHDEVGPLVANARVIVVPSELYESFGLSVVEAYACARPVIASRIGALGELVRDSETGIAVAPGDSAALGEALRSLYGDPERAKTLGRRGRVLAVEEFGPERFVERTLALYRDVLK